MEQLDALAGALAPWLVLASLALSAAAGYRAARIRAAATTPAAPPALRTPEPSGAATAQPSGDARPPPPAPSEDRPRQLPARTGAAPGAGVVAAVTAAAPLAALGLYVHHRRFLGYHRHKGIEASASFARWLREEVRGAGVLGWWHVRGLLPDGTIAPPPEADGRRMVLCIHGYSQNGTNFHGLRRVLGAAGHPTTAVHLGHRLAPISWYTARLERQIEALAAAHSDGFDIVAHSMGGVLLRVVMQNRPDLRDPVRTVVTLGSPHRGTAAARGIPLLPEVRALKRRSLLLRDLPPLPALLPEARIVTVAGDLDTVVYPVDTALVEGTESIVLRGVGHAGLLTSPRALATVRRVLSTV